MDLPILLILVCFGNAALDVRANEPAADCSYSYLNDCGMNLMVYGVVDGVFGAPVNEIVLAEHCRRQEAAEECVKQRTDNCTTGVVKGIARFMMDAVHDEREIRCDPSTPEHRKYLEMATCLNSISAHILGCMRSFERNVDVFAEAAIGRTLRQKIPHGCCIFNEYVSCVVDETKRICGEEAGVFNEQLTSGAVGELIASACEPYKSGEKKCEAFIQTASPTDAVNDGNLAFLGALAKLSDAFRTRRS